MSSCLRSKSSKLVAQRSHWHHCDIHSGVIDTAVTCTTVSLIPLFNQLCRKYSQMILNTTVLFFMREYDSAAHGTAVSVTPLWHAQRSHWHRCDMPSGIIDSAVDIHNGVIDTAVTCTAVSLTPLWHAQRCHWHRCTNMAPLCLWISYSSGSGYL
jgi:hypothetical protein